MGKRELREFEDGLSGTSGALPDGAEDRFHFFDEMYPFLLKQYESARADVAGLGMTDIVETALRDCVTLAQQGRRDEAQRLLLDACIALGEKSGTMDEMRRIYTAANDSQGR